MPGLFKELANTISSFLSDSVDGRKPEFWK